MANGSCLDRSRACGRVPSTPVAREAWCFVPQGTTVGARCSVPPSKRSRECGSAPSDLLSPLVDGVRCFVPSTRLGFGPKWFPPPARRESGTAEGRRKESETDCTTIRSLSWSSCSPCPDHDRGFVNTWCSYMRTAQRRSYLVDLEPSRHPGWARLPEIPTTDSSEHVSVISYVRTNRQACSSGRVKQARVMHCFTPTRAEEGAAHGRGLFPQCIRCSWLVKFSNIQVNLSWSSSR